jgi:hypothetical protein
MSHSGERKGRMYSRESSRSYEALLSPAPLVIPGRPTALQSCKQVRAYIDATKAQIVSE